MPHGRAGYEVAQGETCDIFRELKAAPSRPIGLDDAQVVRIENEDAGRRAVE
jgi:hypothetical protein